MDRIIYYAVGLVIAIITFLLGKYVFPHININSDKIATISAWVYKFVVSAKNQFDGKYTGEQKLEYVTTQIKTLCDKYKIELNDEQIRALIEDAYDMMKETQLAINTNANNTDNSEENKQ